MIKKSKIIISVIIAVIIISSSLYAFYIPNNDVMINKNIDYNSKFNLLSDNKKDIFIINISLINVPDGCLYIYPYITLYENKSIENKSVCSNLYNTGILNINDSISIGTYIELRYQDNCMKIVDLENINSETASILVNNTQNWNSCLGNIKVNNKNSTMEIIIVVNTKDRNIKNIDNYSYNINATLKKLEIIDKTYGYFHYMDYINEKNYYIKPEIKILNITS